MWLALKRAVLDLLEHDTVSCHGTVPSAEKTDVEASLTPMASFAELLPAILPRCGIGSTSPTATLTAVWVLRMKICSTHVGNGPK